MSDTPGDPGSQLPYQEFNTTGPMVTKFSKASERRATREFISINLSGVSMYLLPFQFVLIPMGIPGQSSIIN